MITIKEGKPYRKHKCSRCKSVYIYDLRNDVYFNDMVYCPVCRNYLDFHCFDRKLTREKYEKLMDLKDSDIK